MLETFGKLGIALGLGLLLGLQRQRTDARLAGFRTFPLVALLGAMCALLAGEFGGWIFLAGMLALAAVLIGANLPLLRVAEASPGVTTEVALLVMFAIGGYLMVGSTTLAIVVCGAVAVLLHLKPQMHSFAAKIGDRDFTAIMQFALISLVILPVLPDQAYGPLRVLNPFRIWLMVVLIVGVSLGGYVLYKLAGDRAGAWATGVLGGLISSTATTVGLARRSRESPGSAGRMAFVVLIASAVVFLRVALLVGATDPPFLRELAVPLATQFVILVALGWFEYARHEADSPWVPEQTNPTELRAALLFGALYAAVLYAVAIANARLGQGGLYVTAVISGLTDMDAITLSVTHLRASGEIGPNVAWRLILVAAMSNLIFKAGVIAVIGHRLMRWPVARAFGLSLAAGCALLAFRR